MSVYAFDEPGRCFAWIATARRWPRGARRTAPVREGVGASLAWRAPSAQDVLQCRGDQFVRRLAGGLPTQPAARRGAVQPGPAVERVAQPRRVLGDVGVVDGEQRDGAAHEVGDDARDVGVGDVLAAASVASQIGGSARSNRASATRCRPRARGRCGPRAAAAVPRAWCRSVRAARCRPPYAPRSSGDRAPW